MSGYLFVHFTSEKEDGEQIYFSISKDGLHWKDLHGTTPVLRSHIGEKGVRDPYMVKHPKTGRFYLIATDLRIQAGYGWDAAVRNGSRDIIVWESDDLIHWSSERSCTIGVEGAGCVWAPEAVYDEEKEAFLVFWASYIRDNEEQGKHRIFASYTNDFQTFSEPFVFMEKEKDVIDSTIIESDGSYYRFTKDETNKCILLEKAESLTGSYTTIHSEVLEQLFGVEGPECYLLPDQKTWCLIVDQFAKQLGYAPFLISDLARGEMKPVPESEYDFDKNKKRHGGVIKISDEEYNRMEAFYQ